MDASEQIQVVEIEDEIQSSYLDYSMSVIIGRALPDVRDGLKPVHRRVLYSMSELGLEYGKPYKKSARVVGDCIGKYHPHGDIAVYDTIVRMAQDFSMRYPLVDGQGNFGSVDGDPPAAMRYTEVRMARIAAELLADIDRDTVDFQPNYDNSLSEPVVLPSRIPNLLVNGSSGIAVGMSTNIPPHNLGEVIDALVAVIDDPDLDDVSLLDYIAGPDFPTGGYIVGMSGLLDAYKTGRGIITVRGRVEIEENDAGNRKSIVIHEIPYQVNKTRLIENIADLVREKRVQGISAIRDESDREGMRIVVELKRDAQEQMVLNHLYKHTPLQTSFGIIMLAIVDGQPEILSLRQVLDHFIKHRKEVVVRRTRYDLRKAEEKAHILEGYKIALDNLDAVIATIRASSDSRAAKAQLVDRFGMTEKQAQAVLDLRLHRLTSMERDKILEEYRAVLALVEDLRDILAKEERVFGIIRDELLEVKEKYGDERRTELIELDPELTPEDLIPVEDVVVTISHLGYVKRNPVSLYRAQRRGGKGKIGMVTRDQDFVQDVFVASTHDYLLVFTTSGRMYWLKVHRVPQATRMAKGKPIVNLIDIQPGERVSAVLPVKGFDDDSTIVMVSRSGIVKQTPLKAFSNVRVTGIIACTVAEGDELRHVKLARPGQDILMVSRFGKAIRFAGSDVRTMGRTARGVRGMALQDGDEIIGVEVIDEEKDLARVDEEPEQELETAFEDEEEDRGELTILTVTEKGYGKRTATRHYRRQMRGGKGIIDIKTGGRNGLVIGMAKVRREDEVVLVTNTGRILRTKVGQIRKVARNTLGVRLMGLSEDETLVGIARLTDKDDDDPDAADQGEGTDTTDNN